MDLNITDDVVNDFIILFAIIKREYVLYVYNSIKTIV